MATKETIKIDDEWMNLSNLALPAGTTVDDVEKLLIVKPIRVRLDVVLPKGADASSFDYRKNAELKKFRTNLEAKAAETFASIAEEDQASDGKKTLSQLNSYLEKAVKAFRPLLRAAIAKEIGNGCKADDLMTAGSITFIKVEFQFGFGDDTEAKLPLLDLTKAFKRTKKVQQLGIAWKGCECVVSVRYRKPFKAAELKELKELLPDGFSRGAHTEGGEFIAQAKTDVELNFPANCKLPLAAFMRKAFTKQAGQKIHIRLGTLEEGKTASEGTTSTSEKKSKKN